MLYTNYLFHCTEGEDYNSGPSTVTFTMGVTRVPFDVPIIDDNVLEANEDFTITINPSSLPNGVTRGSPGATTVTIADDDGMYVLHYKVSIV